MELIGWAISNWKLVLIGLLLCGWTLTYALLQSVKLELVEKTAVIDSIKREAQEQAERNKQANKEIVDEIPRMVEQAEANAYANYLKKFGRGNAACGIRAVSVLPAGSYPAATGSAERTDAAPEEPVAPEREFVEACAYDAGTVMLWQQWATRNQVRVE